MQGKDTKLHCLELLKIKTNADFSFLISIGLIFWFYNFNSKGGIYELGNCLDVDVAQVA